MSETEHGDDARERISWSVETRLEFVEFRLFWDGRVNRGDLVRHFGISVPQASTDLARYQQLAPGNLLYDRNAKTYAAAKGFTPRCRCLACHRRRGSARERASDGRPTGIPPGVHHPLAGIAAIDAVRQSE